MIEIQDEIGAVVTGETETETETEGVGIDLDHLAIAMIEETPETPAHLIIAVHLPHPSYQVVPVHLASLRPPNVHLSKLHRALSILQYETYHLMLHLVVLVHHLVKVYPRRLIVNSPRFHRQHPNYHQVDLEGIEHRLRVLEHYQVEPYEMRRTLVVHHPSRLNERLPHLQSKSGSTPTDPLRLLQDLVHDYLGRRGNLKSPLWTSRLLRLNDLVQIPLRLQSMSL